MKTISDFVKNKYRMAPNCGIGTYIFKGIDIDTSTVDLATLDNAVADGFDVVERLDEPVKVDKNKK